MNSLRDLPRLLRKRGKLLRQLQVVSQSESRDGLVEKYAKYVNDPVGFIRDVLHIELTPLQQKAACLLLEPPYVVHCISAHEQGKSILQACIVIWWHCTRSPAIIITTAPTDRQVKSILWKEIRRVAKRAGLKLAFQPKDSKIERSPDDFVWGGTARDDTGFQGQHGPNQLFCCDESTGIDGVIFDAIEGMFSPPGHAWILCYNPTDTGTRIFQEYSLATKAKGGHKAAHIVRMSALDHPNIDAELKGEPPPVPHAMRLEKFDRLFRKWSQLVGCEVGDTRLQLPTDVVWPPEWAKDYCDKTKQRPRVWRPGPVAEARLLGRFPRQGINSVWSDGDWICASREGMRLLPTKLIVPQIGCDVARFGDDYTEIHVRIGPKSVFHEAVNGQDTVTTAKRLMELADYYANWYNRLRSTMPMSETELVPPISGRVIPIKVDDDGIGGAAVDILAAEGYNAIPVSAGSKARVTDDYPNKRSELWFSTAERAREDAIDLSGIQTDDKGNAVLDGEGNPVRLIDEDTIDELKRQAMAATWSMDSRQRRIVCPKDEQKQKLGRSPDGIDAVALCYYEPDSSTNDGEPLLFTRTGPLRQRR